MTSAMEASETPATDGSDRRSSGSNLVLSIVFLALATATLLVTGLVQLLILGFTDECQPSNCSQGAATIGVAIAWLLIVVVFTGGTILSIVRLVGRRRAWPIALVTLLFVAIGSVVGFVVYAVNAGPIS